MYCKVCSAAVIGLSCHMIEVEADVSEGLPVFDMVGFLACEVREARERVRTALRNCGYALPPKRITINLSPADVRKEGAAFDLPIAVAVLSGLGYLPENALEETLLIGELGLDGELHGVRGILPIVMEARKQGVRRCLLPKSNEKEGRLVRGIHCIGAENLQEVIALLSGWKDAAESDGRMSGEEVVSAGYEDEEEPERLLNTLSYKEDFADLAGQEVVKRGAQIAAAGFHNLLLVGPPGAGKTMIARRIPGILPPLSLEESLEITQIYSVAGLLPPERPLITLRPFRAPHHTVTPGALIGGGRNPRPGEISLSNRGVLFLDELTEYKGATLDLLRQPLEDGEVVISRLGGTYRYPAHFMLVAAMNPCRCGYYPDRSRCTCSMGEINAYLSRISQPLLDRIDLCVETPEVVYEQLSSGRAGESSASIRAKVLEAFERQKRRYRDTQWRFNSQIPSSEIRKFCPLGEKQEQILRQAFETLHLSARAYHKVIRTARTIADLDGSEKIENTHIAEAIGYRSIDKKYWKPEGY